MWHTFVSLPRTYTLVVCAVLETADTLGEVTESVDYYVDGCTILAGNLFCR